MSENINFFLLTLTSFFSLLNPLGTMPVFMSMTSNLDQTGRRKTALKALIVAFLTIIAFSFSGQLLFDFFGISANGFRVAGGIIFFIMGYDMLQARLSKIKIPKKVEKEYITDISVTPLAIPLLCGPGSITNGIVLMEDAQNFWQVGLLVLGVFLICVLTFFVLWSSGKLSEWMGETGNKVMMRLMGLIIMVVAVEFFVSGISPIVKDILGTAQ